MSGVKPEACQSKNVSYQLSTGLDERRLASRPSTVRFRSLLLHCQLLLFIKSLLV